jgi:hypothetical protein
MEINKRLKFLIMGLIMGLFWTIYSLYNMRRGKLVTNDLISIIVVCVFMIGLFFYFKKKWKNEQ